MINLKAIAGNGTDYKTKQCQHDGVAEGIKQRQT